MRAIPRRGRGTQSPGSRGSAGSSSGVRVLDIINLSSSADTLLRNRVLAMRARGMDNRIMCMPGPYVKTLNEQGIPTRAVGLPRTIQPFRMIAAVAEMASYMRRERVEILHTHCVVPGILGRIAGFLAGVPTIVHTIHGFDLAGSPGPLLTRLYMLTEKVLGRITRMSLSQNRADLATVRDLKIVPSERLRFIGNGIDLRRFRPEARTRRDPQAPVTMLCTARFEPVKNHPMLFDAIRRLKDRGRHVRLLLVGTGYLRAEYERRCAEMGIADMVEFLGYRDDMPELLAQADMAVLTSIDEGIPRAMLEAMAMRVPVVATDVVGTKETVVDGETGFLVPLNDVEAFVDRLVQLIDDVALRERMGERGRAWVESEFDEDKIIDALAGLYGELLVERNRLPETRATPVTES
jgi:glycosyltransferase involved in cell wall biosynthesis